MNLKGKKIIFCYIALSVLILGVVIYLNFEFRSQYPERMDTPTETIYPNFSKEPLAKFSYKKILDNVDQKKLFSVFQDIENYPNILPNNVISVNVIERSMELIHGCLSCEIVGKEAFEFQERHVILAEEEIREQGITVKILVEHTFEPPFKHVLVVKDGDAKGTTIIQEFSELGSSQTELRGAIELRAKGILVPFVFIAQNNLKHATNTVMDTFIDYAKNNLEDIEDELCLDQHCDPQLIKNKHND
jgi:ribosome-associated toxin RatA of RatAB toxin-antitoxin module